MTSPEPQRFARLTDHVVLVSIDGLRPQIYRDERWPAPVLHELARRGAVAPWPWPHEASSQRSPILRT